MLKMTYLDLAQETIMKYKNYTVLFTEVRGHASLKTKMPNIKIDYINKIVECGIVSDRMYDHVSAHDMELRDM